MLVEVDHIVFRFCVRSQAGYSRSKVGQLTGERIPVESKDQHIVVPQVYPSTVRLPLLIYPETADRGAEENSIYSKTADRGAEENSIYSQTADRGTDEDSIHPRNA